LKHNDASYSAGITRKPSRGFASLVIASARSNPGSIAPCFSALRSPRLIATIIALCLLAPLGAPVSSASYTPPYTVIRAGLFFGANEIPSGNLRNADGLGAGFDFGYLDSDRAFVPIGAWTDEKGISMLMDRNVAWNASAAGGLGEYQEGSSGSAAIGCFHVQLNDGYGTYEEARAEAGAYKDAFVRYQADKQMQFLVLVGHYTTRAAAESAMASLEGNGAASINSGTSNTITVARTGTNVILFEFDRGTTPLAVMPRPDSGEKPETWFRGFRYNGGFIYSRRDGALLTVANAVDVEDYVKGILPYEMNNAWPLEALKAQAVCARTYAVFNIQKHGASGFDLCVEEHCQVYRGRGAANASTDRAVEETAGMYVTYNGQLAQTFYAASNGGASENVENVWPETLPYLRGVTDPYEADIALRVKDYFWTVTYTPAQLTERLRSRITGFNLSTIASMRVSQYSPTGNALKVTLTDVNGRSWTLTGRSQFITGLGTPTMRFDIGSAKWEAGSIFANDPGQPVPISPQYYGIDGKGVVSALPGNAMYAITGEEKVELVEGESTAGGGNETGLANGVFTIRGSGNGHQVGMSQWGAYSMALYHNKTFEDIIRFYFTGVDITRTND